MIEHRRKIKKSLFLSLHPVNELHEQHVLEYIREISRVKMMAIVHGGVVR